MVDLKRHFNCRRALRLELGFLPVLVVAILMFLVSPMLADSDAGLIALSLLAFVTLLAALFAAEVRRRPFTLAVGLSGFAWLLLILQTVADVEVLLAPRALISIGIWVVAPVAVLARVLRDRRVTLNTVYGALAAYFLIGLAWGFLYDTIEVIDAGSFAFPGPPQESYTDELLYFSLVTQTTLGFGDVTPIKAIPRTMSAVQAVVGQFYLVVLVARLVAVQLTYARDDGDPR